MPTTAETLSAYARLTAADANCDFATAVRHMADEPGEVAADTELAIDTVRVWCAATLAAEDPEALGMPAASGCTDPDDEHADCTVPCGLVECEPAS